MPPPHGQPVQNQPPKSFSIGKPPMTHGQRVGIYGSGGIGKTSLAALFPGRTVFIDLDESLPTLKLDGIEHVTVNGFDDVLGALNADIWGDVDNIVIDSATKLELIATTWVIANVPHEKAKEYGIKINRIEDYGFGKGYQHIYDTFLKVLSALDQHVRAGRWVTLIMHDCTNEVLNPQGENYRRFEPRLQSPNSGKASIRLSVKEWLDHLLFIGYDVDVKEGGKAIGRGTRMIQPAELPWCMAKSRSIRYEIPYDLGSDELWRQLRPEKYETEGE